MRVIGGTYRSRRLAAPRGLATRPTSDRLRETLFNVLAPRIEGAVFADLYAGSGAVGIEAISRGASLVYFVDSSPAAVAAIRSNLAALKITSGFQILSSTVSAALRRLTERSRWSIVFLDPPYAAGNDYAGTLNGIGHGADSLLTPDGIVIAEHSRKMLQPLAESYGPLKRYRVLEQGDAGLSFYTR
ncbi:MAG: rRNA (guanine966-N2)-methyltransferase [Acidobacteriaceae bacterium]|jgi:16S rRNA (guanine(966)-N(2))-methyltransferase RsmD|nr:rRNA (guanine966-N2)-methyltransferase [Acidobacteriaceae bacterium]